MQRPSELVYIVPDMRLLSLFALALLVYGADPREVEIRKAQDTFARCWNAHAKDNKCMDQILTPDFNWVSLGGKPEDRSAFIDRIQKMPESNTWTTAPDAL